MKVFVVYNYNDAIDKIFDTRRKALDYVIKKYYSHPEYRKLGPTMLDDNARGDVEEKELE